MTKLHSLPVIVKPKSRSRSISSDDERLPGHFKRREIKVRNIRRGKTGSVSPESHNKRKVEKLAYPKNWLEYIQQNLNRKKDQELKSKLFPSYKRQSAFEMYKRIYNPQTPSMRIEPFVFSTNSGSKEVPPFFVRFTKTYPSVQYSINSTTNNESFITRKQLYLIISKEAKEIIEKLINSNHRSPAPKMLKERHWFNKSWKKIGTGESKFVENSVGLSFLQNYSDDDNDANDEEEIIICSRVTTSEKPSDQPIFEDMVGTSQSEHSEKMVDIGEKQDTLEHIEENAEIAVDMPEQILNEISPQITEPIPCDSSQEVSEKHPQESIEATPEVIPEEVKDSPILDENEIGQTPDVRSSDGFRTPELRPKSVTEDRELDETRRAIEQLEDELKRKQEILKDDMRHVIELELKNVKKKKNKNADVKDKSKKKKKKAKAKKHVSSEDESSNLDEKKKRKKKSKGKKLKKKSEDEKPKKRTKKKKKRNDSVSDSSIDEEEEDELPKKKTSKKKKRKETSKKNKKKQKKSKKTDWDETDEETIDECSDEDKTESRKLKKFEEEHISKRKGDKHTSKGIFEIVSSKDESDNKEFGIELKINKKYLMRKGEKREVDEDDHLNQEESMPLKKSAKLHEKDKFTSNKEVPEKSPYPLWESDEEVSPTKSLQKLNSSWESDEEVFVRRHYEPDLESEQCVSKSYNNDNCGKLEIPLNIKPYKRRDTFEPEIDLRILMEKKRKGEMNFVGQIASDEKKKTQKREDTLLGETTFDEDISEPIKSPDNKNSEHFEDHIDLINPTVSEKRKKIEERSGLAGFNINFEEEVAITEKKLIDVENLKMNELECKISQDTEKKEEHLERIKDVENSLSKPVTPKRGRWDKRESTVKVSTPKSETDSVSTQSFHSEKNNSNSIIDLTANNASLENEYEEFLKAVTSNVAEDPEKSMPISISSMSDVSDTESLPVSFKKNDFLQKDIPPVQVPVVLPKDIPFIPMPTEVSEIKPVPVPSPQIEVKKPLVTIDLDLIPTIQKPNVIIPPLSSVDLEVQGIKSNATMQTPPSTMDDASLSNSIDTNISNSADINISNSANINVPNSIDMNVDLDSIVLPPSCESTSPVEEPKHETVEETLEEQITEDESSTKPPEKQFSFSGMVLTTKKLLLDKPKLHFGDSDDDEPKTSLTKLEDVKKDNLHIIKPKGEKTMEEKLTVDEKNGSEEKKTSEERKELEQPLKETVKEETKVERKRSRSRSPHMSNVTGKSKEGDKKREGSPHKRRRSPSPRGRRRSSPSRRKESPRKGSSPRRRSPGRRRTPEKKKHSSRRTPSPRRGSGVSSRKRGRRSTTPRKRGLSPKKRSPSPKKRSLSPRRRPSSPKRKRSPSPRRRSSPRRGGSPKSSSKKLRSKSPERIQTISEIRPR
ncbi:unnamed protein product [Callosobruchus maculatus]|nr:unnamed protein product [Callosobruchus maculatus]